MALPRVVLSMALAGMVVRDRVWEIPWLIEWGLFPELIFWAEFRVLISVWGLYGVMAVALALPWLPNLRRAMRNQRET